MAGRNPAADGAWAVVARVADAATKRAGCRSGANGKLIEDREVYNAQFVALLAGCAWLLLTQAAYPAPLTPSDKVHKPLDALLQRDCPAKHLDFLSPADFNDAIDPFRNALPSAARQQLDQTADPAKACTGTAAAPSCANLAYIKAATQLKLLPLFASKICTLPLVCGTQSRCSEQAHS